MTPSFEFQQFPRELYRPRTLLDGFHASQPESFAHTRDFRIYREFIADGGGATGDYLTAMSRALHDNGITQHVADFTGDRKVVAIMGGHAADRGSPPYRQAAEIAAALTARGFLVASGGGPGVMEAVHLGASFGDRPGLEDAIAHLCAPGVPLNIPPDAGMVVADDGTVNRDVATRLGAYLAPAVELLSVTGDGGGLGIPTWLYGHEPFTPFAARVAKYFQNSIREDGLLALATHGVIYMPGSAGTLQEVFQDAAQNCYHTFPMGPGKRGEFSPMVFVGKEWISKTPVEPVLKGIFTAPQVAAEAAKWVKFTGTTEAVVDHVTAFQGTRSSLQIRMNRAVVLP